MGKDHGEGPEWVLRWRKRLKEALGLDVWEISLTFSKTLGDDDFGTVIGRCTPHLCYLRAEIELDLEHVQEETTEAKITLIHEFLHVALARTQRVVQHWADDGPKQGDLLRHLYGDSLEETVVRLSYSLLPLIEAMPDADDDEKSEGKSE